MSRSRVSASVYWSNYNSIRLINDLFWIPTDWMFYKGYIQMFTGFRYLILNSNEMFSDTHGDSLRIPSSTLSLTSSQQHTSICLSIVGWIICESVLVLSWSQICHHSVLMQLICILITFMICCKSFYFEADLKYPEKDTVAKNIPITTVDPLISKTRISATVTIWRQ